MAMWVLRSNRSLLLSLSSMRSSYSKMTAVAVGEGRSKRGAPVSGASLYDQNPMERVLTTLAKWTLIWPSFRD